MRLANFKLRFLLFFAERLRNWANSVEEWAIEGQERPPGEPVGSPDVNLELPVSESGSYSSSPTDWAKRTTTGPPPHWVELVQQKAPELLFPIQDDIVPVQASEDLSEEGYSEADGDLEPDRLRPEPGKKSQAQPPPKNRARKILAKGRSFVRPSRLPFKFLREASEFARRLEPSSDQEVPHSNIPESVERSKQEQGTESPSVAFQEAQRASSGEKDLQIRAPRGKRPASAAAMREPHRALTLYRSTRTSFSRTSASQPQPEMDLQETERTAGRPLNSSLEDFSSRADSAARAIVTGETRRPAVSVADNDSSSRALPKTKENPRSSESIRAVSRRLRMQETVTRRDSTTEGSLRMTDELARESRLRPSRSARAVNQSRRFSQPSLQTSAGNLPSLMDEETMNEAASVPSAVPESGENPWPDLPTAPDLEIADEVAARERQIERLQRLEREQRGTLWNV